MFRLLKKMKKGLTDPRYFIILLNNYNLYHIRDDKKYIEICYKYYFKKNLDLNDPKGFNEKLQWLKLNDRKECYHKLVDKYEVRKYVKSKIGQEYLIPIIGIWDKFEDIDFLHCPQSFVLKCTHDSGTVAICENKDFFNFDKEKNFFDKRMKRNFYLQNREWPYKGLKPRIIMEQNLCENGNVPNDYKFMCFSGKVKAIQLHEGRFGKHKLYFYDENANPMTINNVGYEQDIHPILDKDIINKMKELAEILSKPFIQIRVDFYYTNNKIFFGELTFYDGAGFDKLTGNGEELFGSFIDLKYSWEGEKNGS